MIKRSWLLFLCFWASGLTAQPRAIATFSDDTLYLLEVAMTPETRERGLMFRVWLPPWQGMLFILPREERATFWMYHTLIPLHIGFYDQSGRLINVHLAAPCWVDRCPFYASAAPSAFVLETRPKFYAGYTRAALKEVYFIN